ncbi:LAGLIDADG family homing endonuclease [Rossellomorea vietnamensis]|uniref:LAGLIDADG family homing endonuclease n=1 Tax=Rossellomorea vietnamensis TaxID=218284 RepID=UPI00308D1733|nr:LAGLIDADG family homing endonuclease [Rossellomorea vietnamensis]
MEDWEAAYLAGIIDGEGSITLTRMHDKEHRRPCITVASTDYELLEYLQILTNGQITKKKNYHPDRHLNSYTLSIKAKNQVLYILKLVFPFLRVLKKKKRASWILDHYDRVTVRNGKYSTDKLKQKVTFEEEFFKL